MRVLKRFDMKETLFYLFLRFLSHSSQPMLKWLAELLQATPRGKRNQESSSSPYRHKGVQLFRVIFTAELCDLFTMLCSYKLLRFLWQNTLHNLSRHNYHRGIHVILMDLMVHFVSIFFWHLMLSSTSKNLFSKLNRHLETKDVNTYRK